MLRMWSVDSAQVHAILRLSGLIVPLDVTRAAMIAPQFEHRTGTRWLSSVLVISLISSWVLLIEK